MHVPASRSLLQLTGNGRRGRYGRTINGNAEFVDLSEMLLTSSEPYIPLPPLPSLPFPSLRAHRTLEHSSFGTVISDNRQEMDQPARARARRPRPPGLYRHFNPL